MMNRGRGKIQTGIGAVGLAVCLALGGCGGDDGGGGVASVAAPITGTFIDSPVNGLHYTSLPSNPAGGVTANGGRYQCMPGDTVIFDLGGRVIGTPQSCGELVTVVSVFGATSVTDVRVRNLAQLLLTLGGIPAGASPIDLPAAIPTTLPSRLDFADPNFEQMLQAALPDKTLATPEQVAAHLRASFATLTVASNGGRIISTPAGLVCTTGTCSYDFVRGTRVTLAALGPGFTGWSGTAGCKGTGPCQILLGAMQAIRAVFRPVPPPGLSITTTSPLPTGIVGQPYNTTLAAAGGTPPYTWRIASAGPLPAGLTLDRTSGQITGTPTDQGSFSVTFRVQDSSNPVQTTTKRFSVTINAVATRTYGGRLTVTNAPPAAGGAFEAIESFTNAFLGTDETSISWQEQHAGNVFEDVGLMYNRRTGEVTALFYSYSDFTDPNSNNWFFSCGERFQSSPCSKAQIRVDVTAGTMELTDAVLTTDFPAPTTVSLTGTLTFSPVVITSTPGYGSGIVGQPYRATFQAEGGRLPYVWSLDPASAPPPGGLSLTRDGRIIGTPTTAGAFGDDETNSLMIRVTDAQGHFTIDHGYIIVHPAGTTLVPNSRVLTLSSTFNFKPILNGSAFYDGQGRLIGADDADFGIRNGGTFGTGINIGKGDLSSVDVFSTPDQIVRLSRWAGPGKGHGLSIFTADQSLHNVSGSPTVSLPATGQTVYRVIASTLPTLADGSAGLGTGVGGTATVDWDTATVSFDLTVHGPSGDLPLQSGLDVSVLNPDGTIFANLQRAVGNDVVFDDAIGSFYGSDRIPQYLGLILNVGRTSSGLLSNGVLAAVVLQK